MSCKDIREIPYNYTSADDKQIVSLLLGTSVWPLIERLRRRRVTGRSSRLLMRFMGDMFIISRNPFIFQELIDNPERSRKFFKFVHNDLDIIGQGDGDGDVAKVIISCRKYLKTLDASLSSTKKKRKKMQKTFGAIIGKKNVCFDPFSLTSHATDATDWRKQLPMVILRPSEESQIAPLLDAVEKLNLHLIPRGGGTGLTGGAVPLRSDCVMVNLEKLNSIHGISRKKIKYPDGSSKETNIIRTDAGVITEKAILSASEKDLVFATDPTSSWASTIGGNISENAGGKSAVLWGTAIDNIYSFKIAMPGKGLMEVRRVCHPLRKILPDDTVEFQILTEEGKELKTISIKGTDIRKPGLGKDITNKALGGVPGIQKEGTDGIITSAEFILYEAYEQKRTFCLEFFGEDMEEASKVIVEISKEFKNHGEEALVALEHIDDQYIKAINYKTKSASSESPKAVLFIDMCAHTIQQIDRGRDRLATLLSAYKRTALFIAKDKLEAQRYWRDRKKLGAIAAHTNAFKLNEDIVLPLEALAEFTRYVDRYNLEEERHNQKASIINIGAYLETAEPIEDPEWLVAKVSMSRQLCATAIETILKAPEEPVRRKWFFNELIEDLLELFRGYDRVTGKIKTIYDESTSKKIVIATHMHAGDGNVHVNIPVLSNDREMMKRAEKTADDIMVKAVDLKGVVSGEHGIGITKIKHLKPESIKELEKYRKEVDPNGIMNPGKLSDPKVMEKVFTPSFNLLGLEARILRHGSLETLSAKISNCVRCGKCKESCCVFYPEENLFYHPRNKNLAIASLIEALLYDAQRSHSTQFKALRHMEEIADHCTICHKCLSPCPVNIDTGEVSILEREILAARDYKHTSLATSMSLSYLKTRSSFQNALYRKTIVQGGASLQRLGVKLMERMPPSVSVIKKHRPFQLLQSAMPEASAKSMREIMPACDPNQALILEPETAAQTTVFYFPGCGSERLFSQVSKASIYTLLKAGSRVVLPPPYLCCGFPARVNAKKDQHGDMTLRDTIIFSQIREMLYYITFDACVVSCGTCRESLEELDTEKIFGCKICDVNQFTLKNGLNIQKGGAVLYHPPCHDSMDGEATELLSKYADYTPRVVPDCCSEAGTLALSRPDISNAMLKRKTNSINKAMDEKMHRPVTVLTNCPSCLQGLGRNKDLGITPRHIAEELAIKIGGKDWEEELIRLIKNTEVVTF